MWYEWIECLALRRVYYLESEYYEERLDELDEIYSNDDPEDPFQKVRPPFLPHPEMRETIPNVSLNSALYKLPRNLATDISYTGSVKDDEKSLLERKLEAAVDFFDQCIPTQQGFTSSVVAVTMVPDATKITKVWGQWYRCGAAMRRLRYIQTHLNYRRQTQRTGRKGLHNVFVAAPSRAAGVAPKATTKTVDHIREHAAEGIETVTEQVADDVEVIKGLGRQQREVDRNKPVSQIEPTVDAVAEFRKDDFSDVEARGKTEKYSGGDDVSKGESVKRTISQNSNSDKNPIISNEVTPEPSRFDQSNLYREGTTHEKSSIFGFRNCQKKDNFEYDAFDPAVFAEWIGHKEETKLDQIVDTLEIEQLSVYAREMSQSASNPCVYGCATELIWLKSIEQLEAMLEDAWETAREANASLLSARSEMFRKVGGNNEGLPAVDTASINKKDDGNESSTKINVKSNDEAENGSKGDRTTVNRAIASPESKDDDGKEISRIASNHDDRSLEMPGGLRQRWKRRAKTNQTKYDLAQDLVKETNSHSRRNIQKVEKATGCCHRANRDHTGKIESTATVDKNSVDIRDSPSYCVVTFTTRQAAVAARQSMADGKGVNSWQQIHNIPMYPLADAPPGNIFFCRGCW